MNDNRNQFLMVAMKAAIDKMAELRKHLARYGVVLPKNPEGIITGALFAAIAESGVMTCKMASKATLPQLEDVAGLTGPEIEQWAVATFEAQLVGVKGKGSN